MSCNTQWLAQVGAAPTSSKLLALHNVTTKVGVPRGLYKQPGDNNIHKSNARAKSSR